MRVIDLTEEHERLYFVCLEDWCEEMKEAGDHKETWYRKMKDRGLRVKLALDDQGQVGGMIQYVPIEESFAEGRDLYFVNCIWVHGYRKGRGNFQKRGMGKALLRAAEADAKELGAKGLVAWGVTLPFFMKASWFNKYSWRLHTGLGGPRLPTAGDHLAIGSSARSWYNQGQEKAPAMLSASEGMATGRERRRGNGSVHQAPPSGKRPERGVVMSVGDYLLLVGSTCATGTMYCADVMPVIPDAANCPLDRLIGQYADPSTGEVPCLIRVTTDAEAPNVSHRLLVREGDLPKRTMGLVQIVSDGPVPWDREDGKPRRRIPISFQLEHRDVADCGQLNEVQLRHRAQEYAQEYKRRIADVETALGHGRPSRQLGTQGGTMERVKTARELWESGESKTEACRRAHIDPRTYDRYVAEIIDWERED